MTPEVHPLLAGRSSPVTFDESRVVTEAERDAILEAARWSPSAGNSQPWGFVVALRGGPGHDLLCRHLAPSSARWAPSAGLLAVAMSRHMVDDSGIEYSEFADYDLGQAVAHLTLQAHGLGLAARQFRAFDIDGLTADLDIAAGWRVRSMIAIGGAGSYLDARERRSIEQLQSESLRDGRHLALRFASS